MTNFTEITGIVTDHDSQIWYKAVVVANLISPGPGPNSAFFKDGSGKVQNSYVFQLGTDGSIPSATFIPDVRTMVPTGVEWDFVVTTLTSMPNVQSFNIALTGSTFNLGTFISNLCTAPRIPAGNLVYAYNITEIENPVAGNGYVDSVTGTTYQWDGMMWVEISGGGGGGSIDPGEEFFLPFYNTGSPTSTAIKQSQISADSTGNNLTVPEQATLGNVLTLRSSASATGPISAYPNNQQMQNTITVTGPGWNVGNDGGWSTATGYYNNVNTSTRGITQVTSSNLNKHAVGDTSAHYAYVHTDGGSAAQSDEGINGLTVETYENGGYFHGSIASATGTGDTEPVLNFVSGNNWTTDGSFLLDITKGTLHGSLNGPSTPYIGSWLSQTPVTGVTLPISEAIGYFGEFYPWPETTQNVATSATVTVVLQEIGGTTPAFTVGQHVWVAGGNYPEQSFITAVGAVSGGSQSITLALRNPNSTFLVFAGGLAGQYISMDETLSITGMRTCYYAFGSLTGSDIIGAINAGGNVVDFQTILYPNTPATNSGASSGFHLYPGAEVVANFNWTENGGPNPLIQVEQNAVAWASGDVVENPHYPVIGNTGIFVFRTFNQPGNNSTLLLEAVGYNLSGPSAEGVRIINGNEPTIYSNNGGTVGTPRTAIHIEGSWNSLIECDLGPDTETVYGGAGSSVIAIGGMQDSGEIMRIVNYRLNEHGILYFDNANNWYGVTGAFTAQNGFAVAGALGLQGDIWGTDGSFNRFDGGIVVERTLNLGVDFHGLAAGASQVLVTTSASTATWQTLALPTIEITGTPTTGQVPVAINGTSASWQTLPAPTINTGLVDQTASRVFGTTYTNTSSNALFISGFGDTAGSVVATVSVIVDGDIIFKASYGATVAGGAAGFSGMVPAGVTYSVVVDAGVSSLGKWIEQTF